MTKDQVKQNITGFSYLEVKDGYLAHSYGDNYKDVNRREPSTCISIY